MGNHSLGHQFPEGKVWSFIKSSIGCVDPVGQFQDDVVERSGYPVTQELKDCVPPFVLGVGRKI